LSAVSGSWKIMPTRLPRMPRSTGSGAPISSSPLNLMLPEGWLAAG